MKLFFGVGREIKTYLKEIWRCSDWEIIKNVRIKFHYTHLMIKFFVIPWVHNN